MDADSTRWKKSLGGEPLRFRSEILSLIVWLIHGGSRDSVLGQSPIIRAYLCALVGGREIHCRRLTCCDSSRGSDRSQLVRYHNLCLHQQILEELAVNRWVEKTVTGGSLSMNRSVSGGGTC